MSDFEGNEPGPDFDDPSYDALRALLADAKVAEPVPADVAARLNTTLAGLVAARVVEETEADRTVVPLRRPARWGRRLLTAAAAIVVIGGGGVGLSHVFESSSSDDDKTMSADSGSAPAAPEAASGDAPGANLGGTGTASGSTDGLAITPGSAPLVFTSADFDAQAAAYVRDTNRLYDTADGYSASPNSAEAPTPQSNDVDSGGRAAKDATELQRERTMADLLKSASPGPGCPGPNLTDDSIVVAIVFAESPATLVLHPESDGKQLVEAWSCDGESKLAAATVKP